MNELVFGSIQTQPSFPVHTKTGLDPKNPSPATSRHRYAQAREMGVLGRELSGRLVLTSLVRLVCIKRTTSQFCMSNSMRLCPSRSAVSLLAVPSTCSPCPF